MTRKHFLTLAASLAATGFAGARPHPGSAALRKAVRFLARQQAGDGCWSSKVYGAFQGGAALTPMVTRAVQPHHREAASAGVDWLLEHHEESMMIYPVHNACFLLQLAARDPRLQPLVKPLVARLRELQLGSGLGWKPGHHCFGGWGYFGVVTRWQEGIQLASMQESNLSPTLFAVAGLRAAGVAADDPALQEAAAFIRSCQNYDPAAQPNRFDDGGFFQMPGDPWRSKAGVAGTDSSGRQRLKSYSSATADGLRGLLLTGSGRDQPRVQASAKWLRDHPALNDVDHLEFYSAFARRDAARLLDRPLPMGFKHPGQPFSTPQREDGSWLNPAGEFRENDPLVATSMAVLALGPR